MKRALKILVIIGIIYAIFSLIIKNYVFDNHSIVLGIYVYPVSLLLIINSEALDNLLSMKVLAYMGKISYSIFLFHVPIMIIFHAFDMNFASWVCLVLYLTACIIIGVIGTHIQKYILERYVSK